MTFDSENEYDLAMEELRRLAKETVDDAQSPRREWAVLLSQAIAGHNWALRGRLPSEEYGRRIGQHLIASAGENDAAEFQPTQEQLDARFHRFVANAQAAQAAVERIVAEQADTVPARSADGVVHHLRYGLSACTISVRLAMPGDWPRGHRWSAEWEHVNCPACLEQKP